MSRGSDLSADERSVLQHFDAEAVARSLVELVRIPSVGGSAGEVEVQDVVAGLLADLGAEVDRWDIDVAALAVDPDFPGAEVARSAAVGVVGTVPASGSATVPAVALQGHLDVVPAGDWRAVRKGDPDPRLSFVGEVPYALSVGLVRAGEWSSNVPDRLVAEGRYGVQVGEDPALARSRFEEAVQAAASGDLWLRDHPPRVTWPGGQFASGSTDVDHPVVAELSSAVTATGGARRRSPPASTGATCGCTQGSGGSRRSTNGPGDMRDAHSPQERVRLDGVVQVARALVVLTLRRCGLAGPPGRVGGRR
jgi:acetylornithine deacetylase/succinyl-diaminopimelate desuccinylase-like protein